MDPNLPHDNVSVSIYVPNRIKVSNSIIQKVIITNPLTLTFTRLERGQPRTPNNSSPHASRDISPLDFINITYPKTYLARCYNFTRDHDFVLISREISKIRGTQSYIYYYYYFFLFSNGNIYVIFHLSVRKIGLNTLCTMSHFSLSLSFFLTTVNS